MSEEKAHVPNGKDERRFILNADGSNLIDHKGNPVTVGAYLSTKPLRAEVSSRKGPGGMTLSYMGGDMITKTLNEAFGYNGWSLEVKNTTREEPMKDDKGRYHVAYIATVRITHRQSGVFREDCGAGDAIDKSLASASGNALKGAVTDAMKRAARHFGEKLGNSLYHSGFNAKTAPPNLKDALDTLAIDRAKSRFGFDKDKKMASQNSTVIISNTPKPSNQMASRNSAQVVMAKQEQMKQVTMNNAPQPAQPSYAQQTARTQYVGNVVMEHSNVSTQQSKVNHAKPSHVTPHHGAAGTGNNAARKVSTAPAKTATTSYVTPGSRTTTSTSKSSTFDPSIYAARSIIPSKLPAEKLGSNWKENADPQNNPATCGLALPQRPGTSRGGGMSPTSAYITNFDESNGVPSMFGVNGTMSQMGPNQSCIAQSLKRKSESMDAASAGPIPKPSTSGARNPYNC